MGRCRSRRMHEHDPILTVCSQPGAPILDRAAGRARTPVCTPLPAEAGRAKGGGRTLPAQQDLMFTKCAITARPGQSGDRPPASILVRAHERLINCTHVHERPNGADREAARGTGDAITGLATPQAARKKQRAVAPYVWIIAFAPMSTLPEPMISVTSDGSFGSAR
jgi:hypothetical protein